MATTGGVQQSKTTAPMVPVAKACTDPAPAPKEAELEQFGQFLQSTAGGLVSRVDAAQHVHRVSLAYMG